ncbi:DnaJ C-terminal domain-containing protein [Glycocaulis abyssi]|uniref:DnaJ C-terminal domain-containing protein n=1 Tax=Glycocaulis abyssi TaxID=1433403 RepID=A0ABV9N7S6_9PROT
MMNPYAILGVSERAPADEIRKAYRKLAKELHPDARPGDKAAEERFKQVTQAFKLLSDPEQRARFDRGEVDGQGQERPHFHYRSRPGGGPGQRGPQGRFEDLGDIFADLFAAQNAGAQRRRPAAEKGADLRTQVRITLPEAVLGTKKRLSLPGGRALDVTIPAGVNDGQVLRLKGQGHGSLSGGPPGALLVEIKVAPHPHFRREGDDIRLDLPISLKEAVLGGQVRAPTLDGDVEVRIPSGTSSGSVLRLKGRGAPKSGGQRGDQLIRLMIDLPSGDPALEEFAESWRPPTGYDPRRRLKS